MKSIKYIFACGTSFTAAGGFEEGSAVRNIVQKYIDEIIPEKREDCAWPAFLRPKIKPDIRVFNKAVPGAGIEHLIRTTKQWMEEHTDKVNETLFLLELSGYGRSEFWSNTLNEHILCNWDYGVRKEKFAGTLHNGRYWMPDNQFANEFLQSISPKMEDWLNEFMDPIQEANKLQFAFFNFLTYLKYKGYEFKIFGEQFFDPIIKRDKLVTENYLKLSHRGIVIESIHRFLIEAQLQIKQLTKGEDNDFHATLDGNREIARQYYEQLSKIYDI